ncbi:MAG: VanZ family protein [Pedosphaera sp.]|nr:VanZ family protein [Pedosphaera sp.]
MRTRLWNLFRYWLPVLGWMASIFGFSTDGFSAPHTSRFTRPFLLWLNPDISEASIEFAQLCVRKTAHGVEYAILAALLWRALCRPNHREIRPWSRGKAFTAWTLAVGYALSDEFHQTFTNTREGNIRDVAIDSVGAFFGLLVIWLIGRVFRRW